MNIKLSVLLLLVFATICDAAPHNVDLAWDASSDPDVVKYKVYWGVASTKYDSSTDLGNVNKTTVSNLPGGHTYYFVVTAINVDGVESQPSNEVSTKFVDPPAPPSNLRITSTRLANISTRSFIQAGDNAMIAGFIITGNGTKKLIARVIGPSLTFPQKLENPTMQIINSQGIVVAENDNWQDAANVVDVTASGAAPTNILEPAILGLFEPGAYTVIVRGSNDGVGIAVVEIYDLDAPSIAGG